MQVGMPSNRNFFSQQGHEEAISKNAQQFIFFFKTTIYGYLIMKRCNSTLNLLLTLQAAFLSYDSVGNIPVAKQKFFVFE